MTTATITKVSAGQHYETKDGKTLRIINGRLRDEGENGKSFRACPLNVSPTGRVLEDKEDRYYLDELKRYMTKAEVQEWAQVEAREKSAIDDAAKDKGKAKPKRKKAASKTQQAKDDAKPAKMSMLDAAAKVLEQAGEPLRTKAMIEMMAEKQYWTSPGGKTPHSTLYAAIAREIKLKGGDARFKKADRGMFDLNT